MKFTIHRTSYGSPMLFTPVQFKLKHLAEHVWTVEVDSLEALLALVDDVGRVIIKPITETDWQGNVGYHIPLGWDIEIYDGYRE